MNINKSQQTKTLNPNALPYTPLTPTYPNQHQNSTISTITINIHIIRKQKFQYIYSLLLEHDIIILIETWHQLIPQLKQYLQNKIQNLQYIQSPKMNNHTRNGSIDGILIIYKNNIPIKTKIVQPYIISYEIQNTTNTTILYLPPRLDTKQLQTIINLIPLNTNTILGDLNFRSKILADDTTNTNIHRLHLLQNKILHLNQNKTKETHIQYTKQPSCNNNNHIFTTKNIKVSSKPIPKHISDHKYAIIYTLSTNMITNTNKNRNSHLTNSRIKRPKPQDMETCNIKIISKNQKNFKTMQNIIQILKQQLLHTHHTDYNTQQSLIDNTYNQINNHINSILKKSLGTYKPSNNKQPPKPLNTQDPNLHQNSLTHLLKTTSSINDTNMQTQIDIKPLEEYYHNLFNPNNKTHTNTHQQPNYKQHTKQNPITQDIIQYISPGKIYKFFKSYPAAKAPGPDGHLGWHYKLLLYHPEPDLDSTKLNQTIGIQHILCEFIHLIRKYNTRPTHWNQSLLIPCLKPDKDPNHPTSYRPITLTNMIDRLDCWLLRGYINYKHPTLLTTHANQFANKKGYSAQMQAVLIQTYYETTKTINNLTVTHLDIQKAFDTVQRDILYQKLTTEKQWPQELLNILINTIHNRSTKIKHNNLYSKQIHRIISLEQGGGLAGILFDLYINNTIETIQNKLLKQKNTTNPIPQLPPITLAFADDITILTYGHYNTQEAITIANQQLKPIKLKLNPKKIQIIIAHNPTQKQTYIVENTSIENQTQTTHLGFIYNNRGIDLTQMSQRILQLHISTTNLLTTIGLTNHIEASLHPNVKLTLYKTYLRSKTEYYLTISTATIQNQTAQTAKNNTIIQTLITSLETMTNNTIKNILSTNTNQMNTCYSILGLSTPTQRIHEMHLRLAHQILHMHQDNPLHLLINLKTQYDNPIFNHHMPQTFISLIHKNKNHLYKINKQLFHHYFPNIKPNKNRYYLPSRVEIDNPKTETKQDPIYKPKPKFNTYIWQCCNNKKCPYLISDKTKYTKFNNNTHNNKINIQQQKKETKNAIHEYIREIRNLYYNPLIALTTTQQTHILANTIFQNDTTQTPIPLHTSIPKHLRFPKTLKLQLLNQRNKTIIYNLTKLILNTLPYGKTERICTCFQTLNTKHYNCILTHIKEQLPDNTKNIIQQADNKYYPNNSPAQTNPLITLFKHKKYALTFILTQTILNTTILNNTYAIQIQQHINTSHQQNIFKQHIKITIPSLLKLIGSISKYLQHNSKENKLQHIKNSTQYILDACNNSKNNVCATIKINNQLQQSWSLPKTFTNPLISLLSITHELCGHALNCSTQIISYSEFSTDKHFNNKHDIYTFHKDIHKPTKAIINPPYNKLILHPMLQYLYKTMIDNSLLQFIIIIIPYKTEPPIPKQIHKIPIAIYQKYSIGFLPPTYPLDGKNNNNKPAPFKIEVFAITTSINKKITLTHIENNSNNIINTLQYHNQNKLTIHNTIFKHHKKKQQYMQKDNPNNQTTLHHSNQLE